MQAIIKKLFSATASNDIDGVKVFINAGVDINIANPQGITALMIAARLNLIAMIAYLLSIGADVEKEDYLGRNAYDYAIKYGSFKAFSTLLLQE